MLYLQQENQNGDKVADIAEQSWKYGHFFFAIMWFFCPCSCQQITWRGSWQCQFPKGIGRPAAQGLLENWKNIFLDWQGGRLCHFLWETRIIDIAKNKTNISWFLAGKQAWCKRARYHISVERELTSITISVAIQYCILSTVGTLQCTVFHFEIKRVCVCVSLLYLMCARGWLRIQWFYYTTRSWRTQCVSIRQSCRKLRWHSQPVKKKLAKVDWDQTIDWWGFYERSLPTQAF